MQKQTKPTLKRKISGENRIFQHKWEIEYFWSEVRGKDICLICTVKKSRYYKTIANVATNKTKNSTEVTKN